MKNLIVRLTSPELLRGAVSYQRYQPSRPAIYANQSGELRLEIEGALSKIGVSDLYCHQSEAIRFFENGANPLLVTPTSSGKSLVYQLAILEALFNDPEARILLLFPLKALEQDQFQRLQELIKLCGLDEQRQVAILDGDTPADVREKLRAHPPNLILTNPDMLHYSILANHRSWSAFFRNLRFIVIDELHIYRGIFGSHVLQVLRRLSRISRFYGSSPRWIAGSATIGNPLELAQLLTGESFKLVERSGAPASGRHFLFLNPVESAYSLTARLIPEIIRMGYKNITFTKSRRATELLHRWIMGSNPELKQKLSSYRAGFLPEERRQIEQRLLNNQLSAVISTSALELGMDIGGIDVCLVMGYPGTISALMQRAGRAGRRDRESLIILVAGEDALDQYFMRHPEELFLRPSEAAIVDDTNAEITRSHLLCAAAEIPLADKEPYLDAERRRQIDPLVQEKKLICGAGGRRWFPAAGKPHYKINIRSIGSNYSIHDETTGKQIGDIGQSRLWSECHPQAIYLHQARQYLVVRHDDAARTVFVRPEELDYYTQPLGEKETEILSRQREFNLGIGRAVEGELKVTEWVTGYQKRRLFTGQLISTHELEGPPQILNTRGFWIEMNTELQEIVESERCHYMGSLHACEHSLISIFPLEVMCDRGDIGGISFTHHPQVGGAAVFVYDAYPGGLGITHRAYDKLLRMLERTLSLVRECPCEDGCPSCVHSPRCGAGNRPLDKKGAILVLQKLLEDYEETTSLESITAAPTHTDKNVELAARPEQSVTISRQVPDALRGKKILAFDLETQRGPDEVGGWGNSHLMGLSIGVLQDLNTLEYQSFRENDVDDLIERLVSADLIVGFNCLRFDFNVLAGYSGRDFSELKVIDLLEVTLKASGQRRSLDALAELNLQTKKSGTGLQALKLYREERWQELEAYCRKDVEITADLFFLILQSGSLLIPKKDAPPERIPITLILSL
ncbi:MAG: DEAD/DEAH box helicase [bacterium]|nr:DEAD/DEAH box helicase [bacterium]